MNRFLDLLDEKGFGTRQRRLIETLPSSLLSHLDGEGRPNDDQILWRLLEALHTEDVVRIAYRRKRRPLDDPWRHAVIEMPPAAEAVVREALSRPRVDPWPRRWREAVIRRSELFAEAEYAAALPLRIHSLEPEAIIERLAHAPALLRERAYTTYQLGAVLFDGDSKTLLKREEWLTRAFGLDGEALIERPVLVEIHLPAGHTTGVLMIENLDSYLEAASGTWPHSEGLVFVYTAGFRGTASRVRSPRHARFHLDTAGSVDSERIASFEHAWCAGGALPWPAYFFGDLDWSGLAMYIQLLAQFPDLRPWRPGYEALLAAKRSGMAHSPDVASKGSQIAVTETGDPWLDTLAQELARDPRFVDQEVARYQFNSPSPHA